MELIMISRSDFIVIHDLKAKGYSMRKIAKLLKISRITVAKKLQEKEPKEVSKRVIKKPSILEPYKKYIHNFIGKSKHRIPYSVILEDVQDLGYTGGRSILQEFLTKEYHMLKVDKDPIVRFETDPGKQMQVDWTTMRWGKDPIYGFVATMGNSRYTFTYFTTNMEAQTLVKCHELAFLFFGGVPKEILYDNMKTIVDTRDAYGKGLHKFHALMYDLSKQLGFKIRLCRPYRAKTKGKVERFNSYLKGNFYRPLVIKLKDAKLTITVQVLNEHIYRWLIKANNRIHGTTKQKPSVLFIEEQEYLMPYLTLPLEQNTVTTYTKTLPNIVVNQPQLGDYDNLLNMGDIA